MSSIKSKNTLPPDLSQADKFKELAKAVEADQDEGRWEDRLKAIARQKPKDEPERPE